MSNEQIRRLRDMLDDARADLSELTSRSHDPLEALAYRSRSYALWRERANEVKAHGVPIFLPHKLRRDEICYVQLLWPDGSDEHPLSFQTDKEAQSWIHSESLNWLESHGHKVK